jgi:dihydrofolate reductase
VLQMQITVDGFVAGPNGEADWVFKTLDEAADAWIVEHVWKAGVHIMGSRTFKDMASYWPSSTEVFAAPMNEIPKVVFTRSGIAGATTQALEAAVQNREAKGRGQVAATPAIIESWAHPRVASGDLATEVRRLKNEPGKEILAHGGAMFARSLVESGLVDEYRLLVHPVALGRGQPLFSELATPIDLKLVQTSHLGHTIPPFAITSSAPPSVMRTSVHRIRAPSLLGGFQRSWMPAQRHNLGFHVRMQWQRLENVVKLGGRLHPENADIAELSHHSP